jgi:hypothetical protein
MARSFSRALADRQASDGAHGGGGGVPGTAPVETDEPLGLVI